MKSVVPLRMNLEERLISIISTDPERCEVLQAVADLQLPEAWIAGGYIRNPVWDAIFDTDSEMKGSDVDVVYFKSLDSYNVPESELIELIRNDRPNPVWTEEESACESLRKVKPELEFEVKNQARMYLSTSRTIQHRKYESLEEAVAGWVETATATGVRINEVGKHEVLAPYGLEDLFAGIVRPTEPGYLERAKERAEQKKWFAHWPQLRFESAVE